MQYGHFTCHLSYTELQLECSFSEVYSSIPASTYLAYKVTHPTIITILTVLYLASSFLLLFFLSINQAMVTLALQSCACAQEGKMQLPRWQNTLHQLCGKTAAHAKSNQAF